MRHRTWQGEEVLLDPANGERYEWRKHEYKLWRRVCCYRAEADGSVYALTSLPTIQQFPTLVHYYRVGSTGSTGDGPKLATADDGAHGKLAIKRLRCAAGAASVDDGAAAAAAPVVRPMTATMPPAGTMS